MMPLEIKMAGAHSPLFIPILTAAMLLSGNSCFLAGMFFFIP